MSSSAARAAKANAKPGNGGESWCNPSAEQGLRGWDARQPPAPPALRLPRPPSPCRPCGAAAARSSPRASRMRKEPWAPWENRPPAERPMGLGESSAGVASGSGRGALGVCGAAGAKGWDAHRNKHAMSPHAQQT